MPAHLLALLMSLAWTTIHGARSSTFAFASAIIATPLAALSSTIPSSLDIALQNTTTPPLTFLGVECYRLDRQEDHVSIQSCQDIFAALVSRGKVYDKMKLHNHFIFRAPHTDCAIMIFSPARRDVVSSVDLSPMDVILHASEVLRECQSLGMGGADVFQGEWRVAVTKRIFNPDDTITSNSTGSMPTNTSLSLPLDTPTNVLGDPSSVQCYHLTSDLGTVNFQTCKPLLKSMVGKGSIYDKKRFRDGITFTTRDSICLIKVISAEERDRSQRFVTSIANIVELASEILGQCDEQQTG